MDGALLVAHDRDSVRADRTLEGLYLAPLRKWIAARGGHVYAGRPPLTLLIDVKSNAESRIFSSDTAMLGTPSRAPSSAPDTVPE